MGFQRVAQAGLECLTSSDPPASASQSAGITGVSHSARPWTFGYEFLYRHVFISLGYIPRSGIVGSYYYQEEVLIQSPREGSWILHRK